MSNFPNLDKLVESCDHNTKLAITAWVFKHIVDHAKSGGSFRSLIYDRLEFGTDAYVPLYDAGGMDISNEFDLDRIDNIKKIVRDNKIDILKSSLNMCDEPKCFNDCSCGTPTQEKFRLTCYEHRPSRRNENEIC